MPNALTIEPEYRRRPNAMIESAPGGQGLAELLMLLFQHLRQQNQQAGNALAVPAQQPNRIGGTRK